jgi:hypothetical protein
LGEAPRSTDPWHAEAVARWPGHGPTGPRGGQPLPGAPQPHLSLAVAWIHAE